MAKKEEQINKQKDKTSKSKNGDKYPHIPGQPPDDSTAELLKELVAHLRQKRSELREEWGRRIQEAELLTAMNKEEIVAEATSVYDNYVEALETGTYEALQSYARNLSERIIPRGG